MPTQDIGQWFAQLATPTSLIELAVLALCAALAWGFLWLMRRSLAQVDSKSILFGKRLVDGVLFPLLLLCFAYIARAVLLRTMEVHVLHIAIPVLLALVMIRMGVKVLQAAFKDSPLVRFLERTISWVVWLALVLWISGLLPLVLQEMDQISWKVGGSAISLRAMLEGALTAGAVLLLALWIASAVESKLLRHASGGELSLRKAASNAVRAVLIFVGLLLSLSMVGLDLTALSVLGGAVGVGIGLGLQKLASNYVSGFVILTERSMRIGDFVRLDNFEGRITDIKTRYTVIRSGSGRESIVPNEMMVTNRVENLTFSDTLISQQTLLSVGYDSDVALVSRLLIEAALAQTRVMAEPAPVAALTAFGANGLEFTLNYWITDPENGQLNIRSDVNTAILTALRSHNIDIPFPQQVVHDAKPRV
ncbi:MAG: mechanosensitive ion channel domain-containing protein [Burkholderiaceae bacterium]